jgi:polyisoprenyl-phosphate glycosyltransferase
VLDYGGVLRADPRPADTPRKPRGDESVELSVVVAVYGCDSCLGELHSRLTGALGEIASTYEVVYVDDRSPDGSWRFLVDLAGRDEHVRLVRLSRNFGQHAAITAGLAESSGRWTVVMDCDLQDPPEQIARLYERALEGYDVVFARRKRRRDSLFRRTGARLYFWLMNRLLGTRIDGELGSFSILSVQVRDAYLSVGDRSRHYLSILFWLGFEHTSIDVEHAPRHSGKSSYTLGRLLMHAADGLFFQTTVLLRWIVYLGFAVALMGALLAVFFILIFIVSEPYPGWTSLAVLLLLVGGFIIMSTGVAGLYIGKIFEQVKGRPLYVVDERVGVGTAVDEEDAVDAELRASPTR